jgi:hypothetical protein
MTDAANAPAEVVDLAEQRAAAKLERDFARADDLRAQIAGLGFLITDSPDGFRLAPKPPFDVLASVDAVRACGPWAVDASCAVIVLVDGWPDDAVACVRSIMENSNDSVEVVALDLGDVDGAGIAMHGLAQELPGRVRDLHLAQTLDQVGWAKAVTATIEACASPIVAVIDPSTVLDGDAFTVLLEQFDDPTVVATGWRGVDVDLEDNWRSFVDGGPGEVDAILGYLVLVRRDAALAAPPHPKAKFYRNADMEWSLALREAGGRLVIPAGQLPVHQERHHGYHDTDPEYRDRESKRTYDRLLQRFRGKAAILRPRD